MTRNYEMKNFELPVNKEENAQYIPITVLIGLVGILLITIYNSAFIKGRFTCQKYILNTYLYILLSILLITLEVLLFEYNDVKVVDIYGHLTGWVPIILTFVAIIGLLIITLMIDPKNVLYMGDDIPDFECLNTVGISTCPRDSAVEIREICDYISHMDGGKGAVRDVIEQVLRIQGKWMDEDAHKW